MNDKPVRTGVIKMVISHVANLTARLNGQSLFAFGRFCLQILFTQAPVYRRGEYGGGLKACLYASVCVCVCVCAGSYKYA